LISFGTPIFMARLPPVPKNKPPARRRQRGRFVFNVSRLCPNRLASW